MNKDQEEGPKESCSIKKEIKSEQNDTEDDNIKQKAKKEIKSEANETEESEESDFDIDLDRLTLIQAKAKIIKKLKKEIVPCSFLNKKRPKPETQITYDPVAKKLCNKFCPDINELNIFLENCKVSEVTPDEIAENQKNDAGNIFDPYEFMKKYNMNKVGLSLEDDLCQMSQDKQEKKEEEKEIVPKPLLSEPSISFEDNSSFIVNDDKAKFTSQSLKNILNENKLLLDYSEKKWLKDFVKYIFELPLEEVLVKKKKLEFIFDLDLTCIYSFSEAKNLKAMKSFANKNIINFKINHLAKILYVFFVIRSGLTEFTEYVNEMCNFHIRTTGVFPYAKSIAKKLEKICGLKFKIIKARECKKDVNVKSIEDLGDPKINESNCIIFDDSIYQWKDNLINVIQSKKFIDKELYSYLSKTNQNNLILSNNIARELEKYFPICYHKIQNSSWKNQTVCVENNCIFYQYINNNDAPPTFLVYSGESLDSQKLQMTYMKNVVKIIYYLLFHMNIPVYESIKLIRFNSMSNKYFSLKYLNSKKKLILESIVKVCGGEIVDASDESIEYRLKKIFLVVSMGIYESKRKLIQQELKENPNYFLVNEKFILDSYYFMTDLEDNAKDDEYNPEFCLKI